MKKGTHHTLETRQKMGEAAKNNWLSPETRQKHIEAMKGRCVSPETRRKISKALMGKRLSPETCKKLSAAMKGKKKDKSNNWKGGRNKNGRGYILIYAPDHPSATKDGYVLEHRLVVEKALGRYLERWEVVHHKNGIKDDNRLENLELLPHSSHHIALQNMLAELKILKQKAGAWQEAYFRLLTQA